MPSLLNELRAEMGSCDRLDILVSFITMSGLRKIRDILEMITARDAQGQQRSTIRILTTTYMAATEKKALDELAVLPGCEVKISLDGRRTRLHAKAWMFHRHTGFGTAYVGSANLSAAAMTGGLEWTVKFSQREQAALYERACANFETLWEDSEFQTYDPTQDAHQQALLAALKQESGRDFAPLPSLGFLEVSAKPFNLKFWTSWHLSVNMAETKIYWWLQLALEKLSWLRWTTGALHENKKACRVCCLWRTAFKFCGKRSAHFSKCWAIHSSVNCWVMGMSHKAMNICSQ